MQILKAKENVNLTELISAGELVTVSPGLVSNFAVDGFCKLELDYHYKLEALRVIS